MKTFYLVLAVLVAISAVLRFHFHWSIAWSLVPIWGVALAIIVVIGGISALLNLSGFDPS